MIALALGGCEVVPERIVEERRALGELEVGARRFAVTATLRGWRHAAGRGPDGWAPPHERWFVAWEVADGRGDADHVWQDPGAEAARARFDGLALERCGAADRAAFRVGGAGAPWRLLVPDGPAAGVGLVEVEAATCADALGWVESGEAYLRDRADAPDLCAHLAHRRRRADALRCLLRQDPGTVPRPVVRQDLPNAANDAGFDEDLLEVLSDPRPQAFAPWKVTALLAELDEAQRDAVRAAVAARDRPRVGWESLLLGEPPADPGPPWRPPGVPADLPCAFSIRPAPDRCP